MECHIDYIELIDHIGRPIYSPVMNPSLRKNIPCASNMSLFSREWLRLEYISGSIGNQINLNFADVAGADVPKPIPMRFPGVKDRK